MPNCSAPGSASAANDCELSLRRAAVQVTAALPANLDEAIRVLDLARSLVTEFLRPKPGPDQS